jgi:NAD(P)-dependent dehydrogenase (short-subunit alcohol dehydrogenase family)
VSAALWDEDLGRRPASRLEGKVAIVTGAGSSGPGYGTGKAAAVLFAREGAAVVLFDADREAAEQTRQIIADEGGQAAVVVGDITTEDAAQAAVQAASSQFGGLHILDNNVGIVTRGDVTTTTPDDWRAILDINLLGMVNMSRFAVPEMAKGGGGSIINVSSISPRRPYSATPYSVSKGAVDTLTAAMAIDHGAQGIRVNGIAPGPLMTPRAAARQTEEQRALRRKSSPLGIEGSGFDIAWAAVYLASDEARYVTGAVLTVDGGVSVQGHRYR